MNLDLPNKQGAPQDPSAKNIQAIVPEGLVIKAPRPVTRRFLDFVFAESPKELGKRVVANTLVPRAKAAAEEAFNSFLHGMLWGNGAPPMSAIVKGTVIRGGNNIYHGSVGQPSALQQARDANMTRPAGGYEDLICPSQEVAERILAQLYEVFNQYRVVAVGDLYEMANLPTSTADQNIGWMSLDGARITKQRDGFALELPRPTRI